MKDARKRLQQILRTVRRDPANAEMTRVDLAALVRESQQTWAEMGREKWKVSVGAETRGEPLWVNGDLSHLQQAIENLVFNARDATFEMRNYLRDEAKREADPSARRQRLLDAAAWKGEVDLRAFRDGDAVVLVKPQFEVGRTRLGKGGVVRDQGDRAWAITEVARAAVAAGLHPRALSASPIQGGEGNAEYLLWLTPRAGESMGWEALVSTADQVTLKGV